MAETAAGAGGGDRGSAPAHPTRWRNRILFGGGVLLAALVRWPLLSHETGDYGGFLSVWYDFIVANGHFAALQYDFYNYNPPYLYLLAAIASAAPGLPDLFAIKAVSLAFEPLLAFLVFRCVRLRFPDSATRPGLAALAALFAPTVVLNGAFWAQCDVIHTTLLVACLYSLLKERPAAACASFGLAFAFKGSALFFLPALLWIAALKGPKAGSTGRAFLWAPLVYLLALLPPWLQGRPLYDLLSTYFDQAGEHRELTKLAPNLYQWIPNDWYAFWPVGVLATVAVVVGVTALVRRSRALPTADLLVTLAAFSLILAPYLLPKMHDRYFFAADVFTVLLAFCRPRFWYAPIAMGLTSANSYYEVAFRWDAPLAPLAATAVVPLLLLVLLGRQLLRDLGYAPRPARSGPWLRREFARQEFARRGAAAIPAALLALALGGMFLSAWQGGRFARPVSGDPVAAGTLARVANLSPDTFFARFSHRTLEADGAVAYHFDDPGAPGGDFALRFVLGQFPRDRTAQLAAARALMALFFFGAAVLAYLSLAWLLGHRLTALTAVLLVFSWFWIGSGDVVAAAGPPALFGVFLAFHGLVVFSQEGRLRPLLVACGAALLFSFAALALILVFVLAYVLIAEYERRKGRPGEEGREREGEAGAFPERRPRGFDRRLPILAGFAVAFTLTLWGLGALNDRALLAGEGARDGAAAAGSSLLVAADEAGSGGADGPSFAGVFRSLGSGFVPGADTGSGAALVVGLLLTLAGVVGAARSRWRVPFLALALSGFLPAFAAGGAAPPEVERLAHLGLVLVAVSLGLSALRRLRGEWPGRVAAGLAVGLALLSGHREADAGYDPQTAAREARIRTDFEQIRRALLRRGEDSAVFVPADPFRGGEFAGGRATAWYLAGVVLAGEERRAAADYLLTDEPVSRPGRLAAGTTEVFLHHRGAHDGELGARIEAAGAPRLSFEFEVFLEREGGLLYVREDCAPEDLEGTFVLHLLPRDEADLPPHRLRYGFENRSFRFDDRALDTGERCVAAVRLPDYELRNLVTGRFLRDDEGRLTPAWRGEFDPSARPGGPE